MRQMIIVFITVERARVKNLAKIIQVDRNVRPLPQPLGNRRENGAQCGDEYNEKQEVNESECPAVRAFRRRRFHSDQDAFCRMQRQRAIFHRNF